MDRTSAARGTPAPQRGRCPQLQAAGEHSPWIDGSFLLQLLLGETVERTQRAAVACGSGHDSRLLPLRITAHGITVDRKY